MSVPAFDPTSPTIEARACPDRSPSRRSSWRSSSSSPALRRPPGVRRPATTVRPAALGRAADDPWIAAHIDELDALYKHLHTHPELSFQEHETARRIAAELEKAGAEVTTGVGKLGVVGVLKNGPGPVVLVRTDMDALPVTEETGPPLRQPVRRRPTRRDARRRDARLRPRRAHDLLRRDRAMAGRSQGSMVGDRALHRPARRGDRRRRARDARGRALYAVPQARLRPGPPLHGRPADRDRALLSRARCWPARPR